MKMLRVVFGWSYIQDPETSGFEFASATRRLPRSKVADKMIWRGCPGISPGDIYRRCGLLNKSPP